MYTTFPIGSRHPFDKLHCWFPIFHSYFSGILGKRMANLMIGKFMMIESYNSLEEVHWSLPLHVMKILVSPTKSSKSWFLPKMKWSDLSWSNLGGTNIRKVLKLSFSQYTITYPIVWGFELLRAFCLDYPNFLNFTKFYSLKKFEICKRSA